MVRLSFSALAATASLLASAVAQNVDCVVNGNVVATVDLDTGSCPFTIPSDLPVQFKFTSVDDYLVDFYYVTADSTKYFNDIANAGRVISIPAVKLYKQPSIPLFHVHAEKDAPSNSTAAIRKRLFKDQAELYSRDAQSDFINSLKALPGTAVPGTQASFQVVDSKNNTSSASGSVTSTPDSTVTATNSATTVITITSCSDNKCHETSVSATKGPVTTVVSGTSTVYTTWCPIVTETIKSTTLVTITSCSDNKCHETVVPVVPATPASVSAYETTVTTTDSKGKATTYTTTVYPPSASPVTTTDSNGKATTYTTTVYPPSVSPVTSTASNGKATTYWTTVYPTVAPSAAPNTVSPAVSPVNPAPVNPASSQAPVKPTVHTSAGGAAANGVSAILALALIPLAQIL